MSETCCTENLNYVLYDGALMDQQGNMFGIKTLVFTKQSCSAEFSLSSPLIGQVRIVTLA